jgi:hypothetical protein
MVVAVEHRHPVAHIVEGDAQLGLALADLVEQPGIVHRDHRLRRKILQQRNLLVGKRPHLATADHERSDWSAILDQGDPYEAADPAELNRRSRDWLARPIKLVLDKVWNVQEALVAHG